MTELNFEVMSDGKVVDRINPSLFVATGAGDERLAKLRLAMAERHRLKKLLGDLHADHVRTPDVTSLEVMRQVAAEITEAEHKIQELWHRARDETAHMRWNLPGCSCGTGSVTPNEACTLHGDIREARNQLYKQTEAKKYVTHTDPDATLSQTLPPGSIVIKHPPKGNGGAQCHGAYVLSYSDDGTWMHVLRVSDDDAVNPGTPVGKNYWYTVADFRKKFMEAGKHHVYRSALSPIYPNNMLPEVIPFVYERSPR